MNASFSSDPSPRTLPVTQDRPSEARQSPSVPISVYRELATELKATQAMVNSLTTQNQQLTQQNQMLRQEMIKFADSAAQLKQALDLNQPTSVAMPQVIQDLEDVNDELSVSLPERLSESVGGGVSRLASQLNQMVATKPQKPVKAVKKQGRPPAKKPTQVPQSATPERVLYTEERLAPARHTQVGGRSPDFSGLWLATTILLIVVSAFGAGFLIMKPLLNSSK